MLFYPWSFPTFIDKKVSFPSIRKLLPFKNRNGLNYMKRSNFVEDLISDKLNNRQKLARLIQLNSIGIYSDISEGTSLHSECSCAFLGKEKPRNPASRWAKERVLVARKLGRAHRNACMRLHATQARKARPFFFRVLQRMTLVLVMKVSHNPFINSIRHPRDIRFLGVFVSARSSFSRGLRFWVLGLHFLHTRLTTDVAHEWGSVRGLLMSPSKFQRF